MTEIEDMVDKVKASMMSSQNVKLQIDAMEHGRKSDGTPGAWGTVLAAVDSATDLFLQRIVDAGTNDAAEESLAKSWLLPRSPNTGLWIKTIRENPSNRDLRNSSRDILRFDVLDRMIELSRTLSQHDFVRLIGDQWLLNTVPADELYVALRGDEEKEEVQARGRVERDIGKDRAAGRHSGVLMEARRVARELAKNGPISIDDVTQRMVTLGFDVGHGKSKTGQNWKGSVFQGGEWSLVDYVSSRGECAHARQVALWALRSWLERNCINGLGGHKSAFGLVKIYDEFRRNHKDFDPNTCVWLIGTTRLNPELYRSLTKTGALYGIRVQLLEHGTGAILMSSIK